MATAKHKQEIVKPAARSTAGSPSDSHVIAGLMYLIQVLGMMGIGVIGAIVIWAVKKEDPFINYHFKQLLVLWISILIVGAAAALTMIILVGFLIAAVGAVFFIVVWVIGMINAFSGKQEPLPVIGHYAENF